MVVLSIEKYEPAVRGMLTRFMTELRASVFVGDIPANTREYIWKYVESQPNIDAIMIYNANNEQGFSFHSTGNPSRSFQDFDGVQLHYQGYLKKYRRQRCVYKNQPDQQIDCYLEHQEEQYDKGKSKRREWKK